MKARGLQLEHSAVLSKGKQKRQKDIKVGYFTTHQGRGESSDKKDSFIFYNELDIILSGSA